MSTQTRQEPRHSEPATPAWRVVTLASLRSGIVLGVLLGWVLLPEDREVVLLAFGVAGIALSAVEIGASLRLRPVGRPAALLRALAPAAGGLVLLLGPADDLTRLAPAAGVLLLVRALGDALAAATIGRRIRMVPWLAGLSAAEAVAGGAGVLLTDLFGQAAIVTLGFSWLAGGVLAALVPRPAQVRGLTLAPLPRRGPMSAQERERIADEVFFDGPEARERLVRFVVLLTIATIIATYGVLSDSAAAVIGGMIVAPLMVPMQALAAALVSGAARRALMAGLALVGGMALVLVLSMLIASTYRDLAVELLNSQVVSRTSPALPDLGIALAAGAAGGFALVRKDVAGSLPGVAIAVSLVPPLCVSGALLAGEDPRAAVGAFLLFAINFLAIVVASGAVLLIGGFGAIEGRASHRLLTLSGAFGVALVALAVPLALTGVETLNEENLDTTVRAEFEQWLEPVQPAEIIDLEIDGNEVTVLVASAGRPPSTAPLVEAIHDSVGDDITLDVRWVRATQVE
jgi:uncharacterized hydrophobic protein (TIGR00271 family)